MPKSVSREIDELVRRRVAELEGREYDVFEEAARERPSLNEGQLLMYTS